MRLIDVTAVEDESKDQIHVPGTNRAAVRIPRPAAAVAALVTVAAGLAIRSAAGGDVAKYTGSALYTVLIHALVLVVAPGVRPLVAATTALGVSWVVELAQLTGVPEELSRQSAVARLVLGSTFNAPDLFWYAVGAGVAGCVHAWVAAGRGRLRA